jgi:hypothetical protein
VQQQVVARPSLHHEGLTHQRASSVRRPQAGAPALIRDVLSEYSPRADPIDQLGSGWHRVDAKMLVMGLPGIS